MHRKTAAYIYILMLQDLSHTNAIHMEQPNLPYDEVILCESERGGEKLL